MALNYIGSKHSLLDFVYNSIHKVAGGGNTTFCDLFAGTGAVGGHFKAKGYSVIANDIQHYSYVINRNKIKNHRPLAFKGLQDDIKALSATADREKGSVVCDYLNNLPGRPGFIYENYSPSGSLGRRQYFSDENASRCDSVRQLIENWQQLKKITEDEYYFLLASLLEAVDKTANTASVYAAFLKKIKPTAQRPFVLKPADIFYNDQDHQVFNKEANILVKEIEADIFYLDPPYNARQYASNYHLLDTISLYDQPEIAGVTGMRQGYYRSPYCSRPAVKAAFANLINNIQAKYIFLSYNNEGLMNPDDIKRIMSARGKYGVFTKDCGRYKADSSRFNRADRTKEYLHYVKLS